MLGAVLLFLNIGGSEMIFIFIVALFLFGGEKLPEIARGLGKGIRDFKDASEDVKREINNQIYNYEEKRAEEEMDKEAEKQQQLLPPAENADAGHEANEGEVNNPENVPVGVSNTIQYVEHNGALPGHVSGDHTEVQDEEIKSEPGNKTYNN
ncbi:MAG: twin-arginine translocase TatA/TatE family subunit [Mucilaginibacter sp.]